MVEKKGTLLLLLLLLQSFLGCFFCRRRRTHNKKRERFLFFFSWREGQKNVFLLNKTLNRRGCFFCLLFLVVFQKNGVFYIVLCALVVE